MINYVNQIPRDKGGIPIQGVPAPIPAKVTWRQTAAVSSVVTLGHDTTELEVGAIGGDGVVIKWISSTAGYNSSVIGSGLGVANFDHFIPAGQVRRFAVPIEKTGVSTMTSVQGINRALGLYRATGWVVPGSASSSILATEY